MFQNFIQNHMKKNETGNVSLSSNESRRGSAGLNGNYLMWVGLGDMLINYSKLSKVVVSVALFVCYQLVGLGVFNVHVFVERVKCYHTYPLQKKRVEEKEIKARTKIYQNPITSRHVDMTCLANKNRFDDITSLLNEVLVSKGLSQLKVLLLLPTS